MLPVNFLSQTCKYSVKIHGVNIQARVVENYKELVDSGVAELRSRLDTRFPIVGFDVKRIRLSDSKTDGFLPPHPMLILVLHVKDQCLVLKLAPHNFYHESLLSFLQDESICFLGWDSWEVSEKLKSVARHNLDISTLNNVGNLAARVLKIREVEACSNLVELASKVGAAAVAIQEDEASQMMREAIQIPYNYQELDDVCFTEEEVKCAVLDAYWCYTIGTKLMSKP